MTYLQALLFCLIAVVGTGVVLTRDPMKQSIVLSLYGLLLALLFFLLQAPDVAFSVLVAGSAVTPIMILIAISRVREESR